MMNKKKPVYCGHCRTWGAPPKPIGYCHNNNYDCSNYKEVFFVTKIFRKLNYGVPLKFSLEERILK